MKTPCSLNRIGLMAAAGGMLLVGPIQAAPENNLVIPEVELCGAYIQTALSGGLNNLLCLKGTVTGDTQNTSGTYIASVHDEFYSYSIEALEVIQKESSLLPVDSYGDWSKLVSGSGTLEVGVMVKASGSGVLNNDPPFPDAISSNTNEGTYDEYWGGLLGPDTKDQGEPSPNVPDEILTVEEVVNWLAPSTIPVFFFDLADPQNVVAPLYVSGVVYVTDKNNNLILDQWAFDNFFAATPVDLTALAGAYQDDDDAMVLAPKNVPVYIPGSGCKDYEGTLGLDWCMISNSRGSGSPEYVTFAPDMDLGQWAKDGNLFWGYFKVRSTEAADEEIYLSRLAPNYVPEPGIIGLISLGLLGLPVFARRRVLA